MKITTLKVPIIIIAVCVFVAVTAFRGIAAVNDDANYFLLYEVKGTEFNAYLQSKAGVKQYQYVQGMQNYGDILGDDRTADLHAIEKPKNTAADLVLDTAVLTLSSGAKEQFEELQLGLLQVISDSYDGSAKVKAVLTEEVNDRLLAISEGDISYQIPLDSYLKLDRIVYDNEEAPTCVKSAELATFMYKSKSNVTIVDGEADFSGKNLTSSLMWNRDLRKISMAKSWLNQSVFAESSLARGDLVGASLLGALLVDCDMTGCSLKQANLSGATFIGVDLTGADLSNAIFDGTKFKSMGKQKVEIDRVWEKEIRNAKGVEGIENIQWIE